MLIRSRCLLDESVHQPNIKTKFRIMIVPSGRKVQLSSDEKPSESGKWESTEISNRDKPRGHIRIPAGTPVLNADDD